MPNPPANTGSGAMQWFGSITVGYSDSDDRLWLRLTKDSDEAILWLSRRLLSALIPRAYELLSSYRDENEQALDHQQTVSAFLSKGGDASPGRQGTQGSQRLEGLISAIDCRLTDAGFVWVFRAPRGSAGLNTSIVQAHCVLELFYLRQQQAQWDLLAPWSTAALRA